MIACAIKQYNNTCIDKHSTILSVQLTEQPQNKRKLLLNRVTYSFFSLLKHRMAILAHKLNVVEIPLSSGGQNSKMMTNN